MFGKLKEKLKQSLSIFSKKAEEEAEVKEIVVEKVVENKVVENKVEPVEKPVVIKKLKQETVKTSDKSSDVKVKEGVVGKPIVEAEKDLPQKIKKEIKTETKEVITEREEKKPIIKETISAPVATGIKKEVKNDEEKAEDVITKEQKSEERKKLFGFFKRKEKPAETTKTEVEEVTEEKLEQLDQIIKSDSGEVIPEKFSAGKEQFEPDFKKIKEIKEDQELEEVEKAKEVEAKGTETKETEEKKGFFSKVKQTLTTKTISEAKFEDLFWNLEIVLLENNVSVEVIEKIKDDLKEELVDKPLPRDVESKIEETLAKTLKNILSFKRIDLLQKAKEKRDTEKKPLIIAFFGINGSGKTTSIAKLTNYFQRNGLSVVLAACDTFRAAAIQQLEEHADKLNVKMIKHDYGSDAAAVAFDSVKYAEKNKVDVVLIDTAGRLHSNTNLMAELEKIIRVVKPDLKIFIGESITGNDCIEQARKFNELVEMDGAILTKADVDEKGGAPLSIAYTIKKPILFLGVGQEYKDLEEFDANLILKRLGF